jgi:hypothetical protein
VALTEAQVLANITVLEAALARGELTVEYSDRRVTYVNTAEIERRIAYFRGLLPALTGTTRPKQAFAVADKGFR